MLAAAKELGVIVLAYSPLEEVISVYVLAILVPDPGPQDSSLADSSPPQTW